jgi:ADP-ribose pyrophosphatase YjhB (NUDIX family)
MKDRPSLAEYKESISIPLKQATLVFLIKENQVLLAMKKRRFGKGKWNGAGGKKIETDKNIIETATRETKEEIGVEVTSLNKVAVFYFYHLGNPQGGQYVSVYLAHKWEGTPQETEEMAPKWFEINNLPYEDMWESDKLWLPQMLLGGKFEGDFLFDQNQSLLEHDIRLVTNFESNF